MALPATVILLAAFTSRAFKGPLVAVDRGIAALLLAYAIWSFTTSFWSSSPTATYLAWISLLTHILCAVAIAFVSRYKTRSIVTAYSHGSAVLATLVAIAPADSTRAGRASVLGADENITGLTICVGAAIALYLVTAERGFRKFLLLVEILVAGAAILHLGSRTGLVALAAMVVLFSILGSRPSPARLIQATATCVATLGLSVFVYRQLKERGFITPRLEEMVAGNFRNADDSGRDDIIDAFRFTQDRWEIHGVGYGADADYLQLSAQQFHNAHSQFWATWVELGLVGLILLAAILLVSSINGGRQPHRLMLLLLAMPMIAFGVTLGAEKSAVFWFVLALAFTRRGPDSAPNRKD